MRIMYLGEEMNEILILVPGIVKTPVTGARLPPERSQEHVEIRSGHKKVNVIVPWYESLMPHCSYHCAVGNGIAQVVFQAELIHGLQDIQQTCMYLFQTKLSHDSSCLRTKLVNLQLNCNY